MSALCQSARRDRFKVEGGYPAIVKKLRPAESSLMSEPERKGEGCLVGAYAGTTLQRPPDKMACLRPAACRVADNLVQHRFVHSSAYHRTNGISQSVSHQLRTRRQPKHRSRASS